MLFLINSVTLLKERNPGLFSSIAPPSTQKRTIIFGSIHSLSDGINTWGFQAALLAELEVEFEHRYTDKEKDFVQVLQQCFAHTNNLWWFAFRLKRLASVHPPLLPHGRGPGNEEGAEVVVVVGEVVSIMVEGTARGQDQGTIMVVIDTGITDARVTDQESEAGHQERREIMIEVRAQIVVAHQAGTGEVLQGGRERGRKGRGRGKRREVIVRMGQRGLTIEVLCQMDNKHDPRKQRCTFLAMQWTNDKQMLWHICRISTSGSGHIKGHLIIGDIWQYGASVQDQVDIITRLLLSWGIRLDLWSEQGIFGAVRTTFSHPCNCSAIRKQPFRLGNPQASSIWPLNFHELRHFWWIVIFFQKAQIWPF